MVRFVDSVRLSVGYIRARVHVHNSHKITAQQLPTASSRIHWSLEHGFLLIFFVIIFNLFHTICSHLYWPLRRISNYERNRWKIRWMAAIIHTTNVGRCDDSIAQRKHNFSFISLWSHPYHRFWFAFITFSSLSLHHPYISLVRSCCAVVYDVFVFFLDDFGGQLQSMLLSKRDKQPISLVCYKVQNGIYAQSVE